MPVLLFSLQPLHSQSGLFFTHTKVANLRKLETTDMFLPGDTIYGVLYVNVQNNNEDISNYAVNRNGTDVVTITINSEQHHYVSFDIPLSSGLNKPKKSGLIAALSNAVSVQSQAFYFQVLPTGNDGLSLEWIKFFANLSQTAGSSKKINVSAGTGQYSHTVKNTFTLDYSRGGAPYTNWSASYIKQENDVIAQKKADEIVKIKADSVRKLNEELDETEKLFPPEKLKSKITDAKLQKELANFFKSLDYEEVYKIYICDADNSSTFLVFAIVKDNGKCFILREWRERQNPYGDIIKFKFTDSRDKQAYNAFPLRCEKVQGYLK